MRVALALLRYFPYGGLQRDMLRTAACLRARGHEVRIFCHTWEGPRPKDLQIELLPVWGWSNHRRAARFAMKLPVATASWDARVVLGFDKLPQLDAYFAADPCFVARAHAERGRLYRLTPRYRTFAALEQAVFARAAMTRILLLDPRQQALYQHWHDTPADRFVALPPGTDRDRRAGPDAAALRREGREQFGVADDDRLLLLLGSDFRRKGLARALRALASLPSTQQRRTVLLAVGADDPAPWRRLAARLGLTDRLRVEPGRDDVPLLLQSADLLIHPAHVENTGTVLLEALAAGLPVLCSGACGYAHFVVHSGAGMALAEPFAQHELDAALARLLAAPRGELRARALAWAAREDIYSMHEHIVATLEALPAAAQTV